MINGKMGRKDKPPMENSKYVDTSSSRRGILLPSSFFFFFFLSFVFLLWLLLLFLGPLLRHMEVPRLGVESEL